MNTRENPTNDPSLESWVESARGHGDFPIQNLPFGVFTRRTDGELACVGVAIGDSALDLSACWEAGLFAGTPVEHVNVFARDSLNDFVEAGPEAWSAVRGRVSELLRTDTSTLRDDAAVRDTALVEQGKIAMQLPMRIGDYTDFYASAYHATNVGKMFRPDGEPLLPNYKHLPVGYHGRASSIVVSGEEVRRPMGQTKADDAAPTFGPCRLLDYELEMGFFIGVENSLGARVSVEAAKKHIFGMVIVNDWSARDIQKWEYVPLGPFNAKNFATSVSPWVVTLEALAPFQVKHTTRGADDPPLLEYLKGADEDAYDIQLEVGIASAQMRTVGTAPHIVSRGSFRDMFWTITQMAAHHTSTGCNLRVGDLLASGTVSGPEESARGCLLELTWRGTNPITLPTREERKFLADGDELVMRGWCERAGATRIGFGECRGIVTPAE